MDYVVGSVAALISGNVTPNRPKVLKRALTPMKHQPSPNVTPKSELVSDRSIFLSPTMQKKKAIVKKSPKRIFENPDLDITNEDGNTNVSSPKVDKVKKHLKDDLNENIEIIPNILNPKSPKNKVNKSALSPSPKKKLIISKNIETMQNIQVSNERTPKKKKKKDTLITSGQQTDEINKEVQSVEKATPNKKIRPNKPNPALVGTVSQNVHDIQETITIEKKRKKGKKKHKNSVDNSVDNSLQVESSVSCANKGNENEIKEKKNKKYKKNAQNIMKNMISKTKVSVDDNMETNKSDNINEMEYINPNAITNQDTDSEHESDDDIESENEETNKTVLDTGPGESSEDEEEENHDTKKGKKIVEKENFKECADTEEEVKRTLFVGNVPFSSKCKKEIKKIFSKYGDIETVRIRTVPVKDARVTPKLAVIKNELHPNRSTVNVYIKYKQPSSVNEALVENNTVLNEHHLRVARSDITGSEHDPKCSVFVGNIPFALEDEGLRAKFEKCGEIESVRIIRDRKTNAGKGFGYVNFTSKDGVELALALTEEDLTIKNRIMRVKRCTQPTTGKNQKHQSNQSKQQINRAGHNYQGKGHINQRGMNNRGNFQSNRSGKNQFSNDKFQRREQQNVDGKSEGAYRRIMNKRKPQDSGEGPANKRQKNFNQPTKEKKTRKEFVGLTAEKKKFQKRKLNKGEKKKKELSEILTKPRQ